VDAAWLGAPAGSRYRNPCVLGIWAAATGGGAQPGTGSAGGSGGGAAKDSARSVCKPGAATGGVLPDAALYGGEYADWIRSEGLENYLAAQARGKGVLVVTGHLGAWELSSFYHSLMGYPMGMVIRRLDNRRLDDFVNGIRCLHGNQVLHKDDFGRGLLLAMRAGETVGILMDTNMTPPQGAFVKFFGRDACTATGLAHVARKTGAAVLPGFMVWEAAERKYVLHFGPEIAIPHTDDAQADILAGTQMCTAAIEAWIRRYPDQWLWIHRRWKTRPAGEPGLY
jgi:KDO2-lipid IV(A) lauroyltransferase